MELEAKLVNSACEFARPTRSALDALSELLHHERAAYHVFAFRNAKYLYDIATSAIVVITEDAYAVLRYFERAVPGGKEFEDCPELPPEGSLWTILEEVRALSTAGFFTLEKLDTRETRDATVERLLDFHSRGVQLFVQTSCNLRCSYCYEVKADFHATGKAMSYEMGCRALDRFFKQSIGRKYVDVTFFGGEPLLNWEVIKKLVAYAKGKSVECGLPVGFKTTTNALLLSEEIGDFLIANRFAVMISLDGDPRETFARVNLAGQPVERRVLKNAKRFVEKQRLAGVREAAIRATMYPGNHSAKGIATFLENEGFNRVVVGASAGRVASKGVFDIGDTERQAMREEGRQLAEDYMDGRPIPKALGFAKGLKECAKRLDRGPGAAASVMCGVGRNMLAVGEDGTYYPCHRYAGERQFALGSVAKGINEKATGKYYRSLLEVYDGHCAKCWARVLCGGQCPWYLSGDDGVVAFPDSVACDSIRRGTERILGMLVQRRMEAGTANEPLAATVRDVVGARDLVTTNKEAVGHENER